MVGLFLWIKINGFCNIGTILEKRNLTPAAAQSPADIVAGMLTHSTDLGMHTQAGEPQDVAQAVPGTENVCHFFLSQNGFSFNQHISPALFPL